MEIALKMLAKGYDLAEIAELTGLSVDAIAKLSQKYTPHWHKQNFFDETGGQ